MIDIGLLGELEDENMPVTYEDEHLEQIALPLGGIGTGTISLGGRGQLCDWEIFNHPDKGNDLPHCFCLLRAEPAGGEAVSRVLEGRIRPPFEQSHGLPVDRLSGVPRMRSCRFAGAYPFGYVELADPDVPVVATLEGFNPMIPGEPDASGYPAAVLRYHVRNPGDDPLTVSLAYAIPNASAPGDEKRCEVVESEVLEGVLLSSPGSPEHHPEAGTLALAVEGGQTQALPGWPAPYGKPRLNTQAFWREFKGSGCFELDREEWDAQKAAVCSTVELAPGESRAVTFYIGWHFPNRTPAACGWGCSEDALCDVVIGNHYATRFADAWEAVEELYAALPGLEERSRRFTRTMLRSTLPDVVVEAALNNISTLRIQTCFRTEDGAFYGFEGCSDTVGCCTGSCTHVWNYEQTTAHLYPSLARSMRDTELRRCTDEDGFMCFRALLSPENEIPRTTAAADGQMGCIMKLYRDWQLCGDSEWLSRLWPHARRALEFCWIEGGWDADRDGVMEGVQHTTYDTELIGPNPLCEAWYLGALRAGEEMARAMGEDEFADELRDLFERGSAWTDANLFNGEYYEQQVRSIAPDDIADGLGINLQEVKPEAPSIQIGDGCLVDQLVGQQFAHLVGLGYLLKPENVRNTAAGIRRYNRVSMAEHECLGRTFALNDEEGMVICSWPKQQDTNRMVHWFFTEFMTGFEYSAAILMLQEGLLKEGISAIADIRERYDGRRRNPWNEAECGSHYARAMAAWAAVPTLSGFHYSAITGRMEFVPRLDAEPFRCAWAAGGAWGSIEISRRSPSATLKVMHGELALHTLVLPPELAQSHQAALNDSTIATDICREDDRAIFHLEETARVHEGSLLQLQSR